MLGIELDSFLMLAALGLFSGLMAGLLGVGGGLIIVPALIVLFEDMNFSSGYLTQMAVATSLATIIFTSLSSIRTHHSAGLIDWGLVTHLSVGLFFGALLGAFFAVTLSGIFLQLLFGVFAVMVALQMFVQLQPKSGQLPGRPSQYLSGMLIAYVSAIFGIGGGSLSVPTLVWFGLDMKRAVAISAACGLPIAVFGVTGFILASWSRDDLPAYSIGLVYLPALLAITLSSIISAHFGAKLAHRLPAKNLKKIFGAFLLIIGIRFIVISLL